MSIKIKDGHLLEFSETRTLLRDESGEDVTINPKKPIRVWSEGGRSHAEIPCMGRTKTSETFAGALLIAAYLNMEIETEQGTFIVTKKA